MSEHRLLLTASGGALDRLSRDHFLWRAPPEKSSMDTSLGPHLEGLGSVPALHVDFVRLAALVFFADRTVPRPRGWIRELNLDVAVSDPKKWGAASDELRTLLHTLTGDVWGLSFSSRRGARAGKLASPPRASRVALFSGGADSGAGALLSVLDDADTVLVSHHDWSNIRGQQNRVLGELAKIAGTRPNSASWRLARKQEQVGSNEDFREEPSRRSRSVVFIALGLAVAALDQVPLLVPENGFTSLNPPLSGASRGSLSTRTTHPAFLDGIQDTLAVIGLHSDIRNPFESMTKGEVFDTLKQRVGASDAAAFLSSTNSCAKPGRLKGFAPDDPCGVCLGCLVRRGAFIAAGLNDATTYKDVALRGDARRPDWLSAKRRETYVAAQYRAQKDYDVDDILALGLPNRWDPNDALALSRRGLTELAAVQFP